jgi:hypothetical protein
MSMIFTNQAPSQFIGVGIMDWAVWPRAAALPEPPPPPNPAEASTGWDAYNEFCLTNTNCVHHWLLDELSGNWVDGRGTLDLTVNGTPTRGADHLYFQNRAVEFDAVDDYGSSGTGITPALPLSVLVWFKITTGATRETAFYSSADASNNFGFLRHTDGRLYAVVRVAGVNTNMRSPVDNYQDNVWHMFELTVAVDGTRFVCMDGISLASVWELDATDFSLGTAYTNIGAQNATNLWSGALGPVSHFDDDLTSLQSSEAYNRAMFDKVPGISQGLTDARGMGAIAICDSLSRPRYGHLSNSAQLTGPEEIAADSPEGYWKVDEISGNLVDSSGNARDLTIAGSPRSHVPHDMGGQVVKAGLFDGTDDIATSVAAGLIPSSYPVTLELVVKSPAASSALLCITDSTDLNYLRIIVNSSGGTVGIAVKTGGDEDIHYSTTDITGGAWFHIAAVYESATVRRIHVNGIEEGTRNTDSAVLPAGMDTTSLGGYAGATPTYASATIAHACVYHTALSAIRIAHHASAILHHYDIALQGSTTLGSALTAHGGKSMSLGGVNTDYGLMTQSLASHIASLSPKAYTIVVTAKLNSVKNMQKLLDNAAANDGMTLEVSP